METPDKGGEFQQAIKSLQEQRIELHEALGGLLDTARSWAQSEEPQVLRHVERLSARIQAVLTEVATCKDEVARIVETELDRVFEKNAEEFVKSYVQRGGE